MARPIQSIKLSLEQSNLLQSIVRRREVPHRLVQRATIILKAAKGLTNKRISQELGVSHESVTLWRRRWIEGGVELERCVGKPKELSTMVDDLLADQPRSGSPNRFTAEQVCQIIGLACQTPPSHLSHWTYKELIKEVLQREIAETISKTTIGRFLKSGGSQATPLQVLAQPLSGR